MCSNKYIYIIATFFLTVFDMQGQDLYKNNECVLNKFLISPAYAGFSGNYEVFSSFKRNWTGFNNSPKKLNFSVNGPLKDNTGLGLSIANSTIGIFNNLDIAASYSYLIKLAENHYLGFGSSLGYENNKLSKDKLLNVNNDPTLINEKSSGYINGDIGFIYGYKVFEAGVSLQNVFSSGIRMSKNDVYSKERILKLHAAGQFRLTGDFNISLLGLVFLNSHYSEPFNLISKVTYKERFWTLIGWNTGNIVNIGIGTSVKQRFVFSYNYEYGIGNIYSGIYGSHEITLGFLIGMNKQRENKKFGMSSVFNNITLEQ
jgi:type IX secretion system PorP/SprF family membrane protein